MPLATCFKKIIFLLLYLITTSKISQIKDLESLFHKDLIMVFKNSWNTCLANYNILSNLILACTRIFNYTRNELLLDVFDYWQAFLFLCCLYATIKYFKTRFLMNFCWKICQCRLLMARMKLICIFYSLFFKIKINLQVSIITKC